MNIFKTFTFTWQQGLLFKWGVFATGIAAGAYWERFFAPYLLPLIIFAGVSLPYPTYVWWKQIKTSKPHVDASDEYRLGTAISLVTLFIGLCLMIIWLLFRPSFENCSALTRPAERLACYDKIKGELSKPPTK